MKNSKITVWLPSITLLASVVLMGMLWMLSMLPQLQEVRRSLLDGFAVALGFIVVITSLAFAGLKRSWIALVPFTVITVIVLLRIGRQHNTTALEQIGRLQAESYASEKFSIKFQEGKLLNIDKDQ